MLIILPETEVAPIASIDGVELEETISCFEIDCRELSDSSSITSVMVALPFKLLSSSDNCLLVLLAIFGVLQVSVLRMVGVSRHLIENEFHFIF